MKKVKRILSMLLICITVLSMAACGSEKKDNESSTPKTEVKDTSKGTQDSSKDTSKDTSKGTQEVEEPVEIRIFSQYSTDEDTEVANFIIEEMEKDLNIKIVRDEVSSSGYNEKLQCYESPKSTLSTLRKSEKY